MLFGLCTVYSHFINYYSLPQAENNWSFQTWHIFGMKNRDSTVLPFSDYGIAYLHIF